MSRTTASLRTGDGFPAAEINPEWVRWVELIELGVAESRHPVWAECVHLRRHRLPDEPVLHQATVQVPPRGDEYVARIARHVGVVTAANTGELVRAGLERDVRMIDLLASQLAISADIVALLGQLSALPVLLNLPPLGSDAARTWQRGYCPQCGAWPSLVEMRGIERERRLRCGCCGGDWMLPVLRCAFCNEMDHHKLGSLLSEEDRHVRVETCGTCRGYLKSVTTLSAMPFQALAMTDLKTVSFDLAAHDRGFSRPSSVAWQVRVTVQ